MKRHLTFLFSFALSSGASARAQIPETFTNLQFFPQDIGRRDLIDRMREFASALGVRCEFCHEGEGGDDLRNMDFASDDKEPKRTARKMLIMTAGIQKDYIAALGREHPTEVRCVTCHHGLSKPQRLEDVIETGLERESVEAAVARYRSLRKEHYGSAAYDFGEGPLNSLGEKLLRAERPKEALALLELNREFFPDSEWLQYLLGKAREATGRERDDPR